MRGLSVCPISTCAHTQCSEHMKVRINRPPTGTVLGEVLASQWVLEAVAQGMRLLCGECEAMDASFCGSS